MSSVIFLEQEDRIRAAFAEACFLLMREMRYGIGGCGECGDIDLLQSQLEVIGWERGPLSPEGGT